MATQQTQYKYSGRIAPNDQLHQFTVANKPDVDPPVHYIAPKTIHVQIIYPGPKTIGVPQYADTVKGGIAKYDPANDCNGYFMSAKFQRNNNCYAYACNIATNTFAQPGKQSGYLLTPEDEKDPTFGDIVKKYAVKDGLEQINAVTVEQLKKITKAGHYVALMISPAGDNNWQGDYHWARCDNSSGPCNSWSQKDGGDQVTNFDFAGNPITDPSKANWTVNQGPSSHGPDANDDMVVEYVFHCFMFVPVTGVNII